MVHRHRVPLALALMAAMVASLAMAAPVLGGPKIQATLAGINEVPGPGDPDGSGTAVITLNKSKGEVCYELSVSNIEAAVAAHIHQAPVGVAGPVVVALGAPNPTASGCVSGVDPQLIKAISKDPQDYYVNVHTIPNFPAGAVRGQLSK